MWHQSARRDVTGVCVFLAELQAKKLSLLRELVPNATLIAFLVNPAFPSAGRQTQEIRAAAEKLGVPIQVVAASNSPEIEAGFASMAQSRATALLVASDVFFNTRRDQIISLAAKYALPAVYEQRPFAVAGGYTGRILKEKNRPICRSYFQMRLSL
jgi:ABC-type uncharacterized transport system substrate-binding protein